MNIALPAFVAFVLLLPGFIARTRIKHVERLSLDYTPFGQVATEGVVWAGAMHALWTTLTNWISPWDVKPEVVLKLLSSEPVSQSRVLEQVAAHATPAAWYFGTMIVAAYVVPLMIRMAISALRLDRSESRMSWILRFSGAPWYYLLSGADFDKDDVPDLIAISAIVELGGEPYLYTGLLEDYFLDNEGKLDRVILQNVMRRHLSKDKTESLDTQQSLSRFYAVDGDYFVLRYSEAITVNIEYIKLARSGETSNASAEPEFLERSIRDSSESATS